MTVREVIRVLLVAVREYGGDTPMRLVINGEGCSRILGIVANSRWAGGQRVLYIEMEAAD